MPADYHTHTPLCRHASGAPEEFVDQALARGLSEYGVSDHAPQRPEPFDDWRMLEAEMPAYLDWIDRARRHAAGRLPVRAGLECDWLPGCQPWIDRLASLAPWDYLIGSLHYLGSWDFDNPARVDLWDRHDVEEVWSRYWREYAAMAESGLFDLLGHPDLVKKFGHRPAGDLRRFYEPAIEAISAAGCAIEINTAGWHKPCTEAYPDPAFLDLARSAGIPLAISSDAHAPAEIGRDFDRARALAAAAGYTETVLFERRQRRFEPLP
jgi:histidinol-phosphatase (PHP family)